MNGEARPNVGKLQRVFAPHYLTLRAQWPQAFAIKPTRGGYEAVVFIEVTDPRSGERVDSCGRCRDARGIK